jgi:hypothetical protein
MATSLQHPLTSAATSTFEALGFLLATEASGNVDALTHAAHVEFRGPRRGRVVLRVSASLLPVVAANMLGLDDAPEAGLQRDALGELANVITGNVVPALDGPRAVYLLDAPVAGAPAAAGETAARAHLAFDEGEAVVELHLETAGAAG